MRTIAVMNQKGGVGETTASVNLAGGLARSERSVCLIDLDPQGHTSLHLGVQPASDAPSVYRVFSGENSLADVKQLVAERLWLIPANLDLAAAEVELADTPGREHILRNAINTLAESEQFDYVIIDCPPSLSLLTINALSAVREVFIPLQPHFFALQGLSKLLETTALISRRLNRDLRVSGVILCLYETATRLAADVSDDLKAFLDRSDPNAPWAGVKIFESRVRRNIKLAEAPSFGQSIFDYDKKCAGSVDYGALVEEVIAQEDRRTAEPPLRKAG